MRVPDIIANPPQIFGILPGTATELFQRVTDVFVVLGQMCVQHHALVARQNSRVAHQVAADGKRGTRGDADAHHRTRIGVVECVDHADAIIEDRRLFFYQRIGGQTAIALSDAHRAAGRVKTQANLGGGSDRIIQPRPVGVKVKMIRAKRTPAERQFRKADLRRDEHFLGSKARPYRIKRLQPPKQQGVLPTWNSPRQRLIQMMVRVHQPRRHNAAFGRNCFTCRGKLRADSRNDTVAHQNIRLPVLAAVIVHGQNNVRAFDKHLTHSNCPAKPTSRRREHRDWPQQ